MVELITFSNDPVLIESSSNIAKDHNCSIISVDTLDDVLFNIAKSHFFVLLYDTVHHVPSLESIKHIHSISPQTEIVLISNQYPKSEYEELFEHIFDIIVKPYTAVTFKKVVINVIEKCLLKKQVYSQNIPVSSLPSIAQHSNIQISTFPKSPPQNTCNEFCGENPAIVHIRNCLTDVARSTMNILIRGESGTGKDIVARIIHQQSGRNQKGNFVKINCPSVPEQLLESELFGHEKGAFTGAEKNKPGRFEIASEGTIFLDEIAEIPLTIQAKLLQFIEDKQYSRLGGVQTLNIDARIVSATNAPLATMIKEKLFRSDLYYRLNEYCIQIPPLRERTDDIPLLVDHYCEKFSQEKGHKKILISDYAMSKLMRYEWPGNVRELRAAIRTFVYTRNEDILIQTLETPLINNDYYSPSKRMQSLEKQAIAEALQQTKWNQKKSAQILGISYSSIRRKIKKYELNL